VSREPTILRCARGAGWVLLNSCAAFVARQYLEAFMVVVNKIEHIYFSGTNIMSLKHFIVDVISFCLVSKIRRLMILKMADG
jgi:hypothetical protein